VLHSDEARLSAPTVGAFFLAIISPQDICRAHLEIFAFSPDVHAIAPCQGGWQHFVQAFTLATLGDLLPGSPTSAADVTRYADLGLTNFVGPKPKKYSFLSSAFQR
jgi:hypothetical protein